MRVEARENMVQYPWRELLTAWSREILVSREFASDLTWLRSEYPDSYTPDVLSSGWLGYPGATDDEIAAAEKRLGVTLPPDYREFLQVSNGWRWINSFIPRIWPVQEIEWLRVSDPDILEGWDAGWDYGREIYGGGGADELYEQQYLASTFRISDIEYGGTAMLLLNPSMASAAGEWEGWFFAHWVPGADTYPSFWSLMNDMHETFLKLDSIER